MGSIKAGNEPGEDAFTPYRHLAVHVLARALRDLLKPGSPVDRESARLFLVGSPMLFHWCRVASIDPGLVTSHAKKFGPAAPGE